MQPKVLFIDWDGTLSNSRFWERWSRSPNEQAKYQLIQRVLFQNAQDLLHNWMCGRISYVTAVDYVAKSTGISYEELVGELRYSCEHMKFIDESDIGTVQAIRAKGTKVLVATDNMDTFRHWTIPALKIYDMFDGVLISDIRGAMKAHLQTDATSLFFNHYLTQNGISANETVLIDDSVNNKVVESFGMNFLHVHAAEPLGHHLSRLAGAVRQA